ncbi:unnamed protein product [Lampetra fluviatilis]
MEMSLSIGGFEFLMALRGAPSHERTHTAAVVAAAASRAEERRSREPEAMAVAAVVFASSVCGLSLTGWSRDILPQSRPSLVPDLETHSLIHRTPAAYFAQEGLTAPPSPPRPVMSAVPEVDGQAAPVGADSTLHLSRSVWQREQMADASLAPLRDWARGSGSHSSCGN